MASQATLFRDLKKRRTDWILKVRLARKWSIPTENHLNFPPSMELVLVDKEGDRIQASINQSLIKQFESSLRENCLYYISNVSIVDNRGKYRITTHAYRVLFMSTTEIITVGDRMFPKKIYNLKSFPEIMAIAEVEEASLIDVIGKVVGKGVLKHQQHNRAGRTSKHIDVELEDIQQNKIKCTLWDTYADEICRFIEISGTDPLVVLIQLCKPKIFQGQITLSNAFYATRLIADVGLPELEEFKSQLILENSNSPYEISQLSITTTCGSVDELESGAIEIKTIADLLECTEVGFYWVVAQIFEIITEGDWSFISCRRCRKKLSNQPSGYFCEPCNRLETNATPRYKVKVNVLDGTHCALFLLWDQACEMLIGKTALQLRERIISCDATKEKKSGIKLSEYAIVKNGCPEEIESLVGRTALFKVHVKKENITGTEKVYSISRVSEDQKLVEKYKKSDLNVISRIDMVSVLKEAGEEIIEINDSVSENDEDTPTDALSKRPRLMSGYDTPTSGVPKDDGSSSKLLLDKFEKAIKKEQD